MSLKAATPIWASSPSGNSMSWLRPSGEVAHAATRQAVQTMAMNDFMVVARIFHRDPR
jgi:hypothetical protein